MSKASEVVEKLRDGKKKIDVELLSAETSPCVVSDWFSSGCVVLDKILGSGFPVGRIVEIYGDPSSGKSLIAAQVAAMAQQAGAIVAYEDTETAVSVSMMQELGVNVDELIYASHTTVEEVFTFFEETITAKQSVDPNSLLLLIWDSVAATSAQFELDSEYGKATMGRHAQLISQGLRKISHIMAPYNVCFLVLNQTREKIGVMFGDNETTFGGKAVSFYASIRVSLNLSTKIKVAAKHGKKVIGIHSRAVVTKNKVASPYREALLPIYFGHGIDDAFTSFYYLSDNDYIKSSGSWYIINLNGEEQRFQKKGWREFYDANYDAIADMIMSEEEVLDGQIEPDN